MWRLPRHPWFWLAGFLIWLVTLWLFSSTSRTAEFTPDIRNFDKVAHFGFFFGGSGLLCAYLFRRREGRPDWKILILTAVVIIGLVGVLDEYHQSFTPGRQGNDPFDWLADFSGALAGALVFKCFHRRLA
jgi:VanZ family protein